MKRTKMLQFFSYVPFGGLGWPWKGSVEGKGHLETIVRLQGPDLEVVEVLGGRGPSSLSGWSGGGVSRAANCFPLDLFFLHDFPFHI